MDIICVYFCLIETKYYRIASVYFTGMVWDKWFSFHLNSVFEESLQDWDYN